MITFKQFLFEKIYPDLAKTINKDCAEFLSQTHREGLLVRGMKAPRGDVGHFQDPHHQEGVIEYWTRTPRTDRKPSDTSRKIHAALDRWFKGVFGVEARSTATFCFSQKSLRLTQQYGDPYVIFPIGDFKIIWSPKVADLYGDVETELEPAIRRGDSEMDDLIDDWMHDQDYTDGELSRAVKSEHELMVICSKYYAIHAEHAQLLKKILDIA